MSTYKLYLYVYNPTLLTLNTVLKNRFGKTRKLKKTKKTRHKIEWCALVTH